MSELNNEQITPLDKLRKDIKAAAKTMTPREARYLVDLYYQMQNNRIRAAGQIRAVSQQDEAEPHQTLTWTMDQAEVLENNIKLTLGEFAKSREVGKWSQSICGIGPVISAGLIAHIDGAGSNTVSRIWRYAGLDPSLKWLGVEGAKKLMVEVEAPPAVEDEGMSARDESALSQADLEELDGMLSGGTVVPGQIFRIAQMTNRTVPALLRIAKDEKGKVTRASLLKALAKRPWNASLKVLCWKIGQSFVKVSNLEKDFYGKIYQQRKALEQAKNEAGQFAAQAEAVLKAKKIGKDTEAYKYYSIGQLPKAHIQARSERYAVKLFLSHWHTVAYYSAHRVMPPKPYVLAILGHADEIQVPNWPF